jgi:hypothetical protein
MARVCSVRFERIESEMAILFDFSHFLSVWHTDYGISLIPSWTSSVSVLFDEQFRNVRFPFSAGAGTLALKSALQSFCSRGGRLADTEYQV